MTLDSEGKKRTQMPIPHSKGPKPIEHRDIRSNPFPLLLLFLFSMVDIDD